MAELLTIYGHTAITIGLGVIVRLWLKYGRD